MPIASLCVFDDRKYTYACVVAIPNRKMEIMIPTSMGPVVKFKSGGSPVDRTADVVEVADMLVRMS
jgi:hypothetical protein